MYVRAGSCTYCGSSGIKLLRCSDCPVLDLAHARSTSPAGRLLERLLDLDFAVKHFRVDWGQISAEEVAGLKILDQERTKKQIEDQKSDQERAMDEMRRERQAGGRG